MAQSTASVFRVENTNLDNSDRKYLSEFKVHQDRNSVQGIATCYELDCTEIESRWERDFMQPSTPALGPIQLLYSGYRVSFVAVKRPKRGVTTHPI